MASTALLMIDGLASGDNLSAFQPIAGEPLIYHQILQLQKNGIKRFIISVDTVEAKALAIASKLRRIGIDVEFVRSLHALGDMLSSSEAFIMLSDAIWCDDRHFDALIHADTPQILVIDNDEINTEFELIDLNNRWAGVAKLDGGLISSLDKLPEDSAIHSTLLRLALQNDCALHRINVSDESLLKITNQHDADIISDGLIGHSHDLNVARGFFERMLFQPLSGWIIKYLWSKSEANPQSSLVAQYAAVPFVILGVLFALFNWVIPSFICAFFICFALFLEQRYGFLKTGYNNKLLEIGGLLSLSFIMLLAARNMNDYFHFYSTIILFMLGYVANNMNFDERYDRLIISFSDVFFIMIMAAFFGLQTIFIVVISIIFALWLCIGVNIIGKDAQR